MKKEFKSAFETVLNGHEPEFTTYKIRSEIGIVESIVNGKTYHKKYDSGVIKQTVDYVFYKGKIRPIGYLEMPEKELIRWDSGNPCENYPSDHYAIAF